MTGTGRQVGIAVMWLSMAAMVVGVAAFAARSHVEVVLVFGLLAAGGGVAVTALAYDIGRSRSAATFTEPVQFRLTVRWTRPDGFRCGLHIWDDDGQQIEAEAALSAEEVRALRNTIEAALARQSDAPAAPREEP